MAGCTKTPIDSLPSKCKTGFYNCLQGKALVQISTSRGKITFEIDGDSAPITSGNFIDLVQKGIYERTIFHRVIKKPTPFVIQGGSPISRNQSVSKAAYARGNYIDPRSGQARFIPLEIKLRSENLPRYDRPITNPNSLKELQLSHKRGSLAMARSQAIGSGSAQFYITLKALPELDGRYAVFGRVIKGMNVVDAIEEGDKIIKTQLLAK